MPCGLHSLPSCLTKGRFCIGVYRREWMSVHRAMPRFRMSSFGRGVPVIAQKVAAYADVRLRSCGFAFSIAVHNSWIVRPLRAAASPRTIHVRERKGGTE